MKAREYAQIILNLGESKTTEVVAYLRKKGLLKLLPAILKELERMVEVKNRRERVVVISAKPLSNQEIHAIKNKHHDFFTKAKEGEVINIVDTTLIGGYRLEHNHQILDVSYKHSLFTLYQNIIST